MRQILIAAALTAAFSIFGTHRAAAQSTTETFLLVPGIAGESTAAGHEDWIDIYSFSQNLDGSKKDQGACTFSVAKAIDGASPLLFAAAANGQMFDEIRLESFKAPSDHPQPFYELTLSDAYISSISVNQEFETLTITGATATLRYFRENRKHGGREETRATVHCK